MRRIWFALPFATILGPGCGTETTGPQASLCGTRNGLEVCVARAEYRPAQSVTFTVRNTTAAPIFRDTCSTKLVGVTILGREFEEVFDPTLRCGPGATLADIVANMVEVGPGESLEESLQLQSFAFQGYYRVNVWVVNGDGTLAAPTPTFSGTFEVFPSAG